MTILKKDFKVKEYVCTEGSWGNTPSESRTMEYHVEWNKEDESGWYEIYDEESGGEDYHGEGCLEFDGNELCGYDGPMSLSDEVIKCIVEWGGIDNL